MFKTVLAANILIFAAILPVKAQVGPGLGRSDTMANRGQYASVCTRTARGRLSMRTGPGTGYRKVKEIPNSHTVALDGGQYGGDGFWWWRVIHNGSQGWARADYICGDPQ